MGREKLIEIASMLLVIVFVYTAVTKMIDFQTFAAQLGQSPILTRFADVLSWAVPGVELAVSGLLVIRSTRHVGLYVSFSLLTSFTTYIILVTKFSEFVPCSCGGVIENLSWNDHLVLNTALIMVCGASVMFYPQVDWRYLGLNRK